MSYTIVSIRLYFESVSESKVNQNENIETRFSMTVDNFNKL